MYALAQDKKIFSIVCIFCIVFVNLLCSTTYASRPDRPRYCEMILRENKFLTDTPEQIIEATKSESYFIRYIALELLTARIGHEAIPTLKEALSDDSVDVRWRAAHLLGSLGDSIGLGRMQRDFAELVPRNGAREPRDPNISRNPEAMKQWQRHRLYRINRALEVAKVLAELGDRRGYELAAMAAFEQPLAANRLRAVRLLAEIAKTDEAVLTAEGKDPAFVLSSVAESEKRRTVFIEVVVSATRLGGRIGLQILEKAKDNPYQPEREIRMAKHGLDSLKTRVKAGQKSPKSKEVK